VFPARIRASGVAMLSDDWIGIQGLRGPGLLDSRWNVS
jgi:hypothetical protein